MKNPPDNSGPAFPIPYNPSPTRKLPRGLTKREYFAAKGMAAILSYRETHIAINLGSITISDVALAAVTYADGLIAALNKPSPHV